MIEQGDLFAPSVDGWQDRDTVLEWLQRWAEAGWLRPLDRALAGFLQELAPEDDPLVLLGAALASHQLGHGHACLDLAATLEAPDLALSLPAEADLDGLPRPARVLAGLTRSRWEQALAASPLVAAPPQVGAGPLVLTSGRLYLRRYWDHEQCIGAMLARALQDPLPEPADLAERLAALFPSPSDLVGTDWQKVACALAVRRRFCLITGGPGTGKTTTVVRLLALLQQQAVEAGRPLRIRLAAPTGKAAARLTESIGAQVDQLPVSAAVRERIPVQVTTLHRLLGSRPDSRHFRHHAGQPLPLDVLVVDEASMIDLEMMSALLQALPPQGRLVLLGDKDQLASVEAGAVLGDLCRDAEGGHYAPALQAWLEQVTGAPLADPALVPGDAARHPLAQCTVMLRHSRRFGPASGIGRLAQAVNAGASTSARALLDAGAPDLHVLRWQGQQDGALERLGREGLGQVAPGHGRYLHLMQTLRPAATCPADGPEWDDWARQLLQAFSTFQLLCAVRQGPWGVDALNQQLATALCRHGLLEADQGWYEGRPVLVTRNDHALGLMNGDVGLVLRRPEAGQASPVLRVVFPRNDGSDGVRWLLPSRLNAVETVFAMTVHKSQGSEFDHAALVLPERLNPVLTRELVYTAVTRARRAFTLVEARPEVFGMAVTRRVARRSGLLEALQEHCRTLQDPVPVRS